MASCVKVRDRSRYRLYTIATNNRVSRSRLFDVCVGDLEALPGAPRAPPCGLDYTLPFGRSLCAGFVPSVWSGGALLGRSIHSFMHSFIVYSCTLEIP